MGYRASVGLETHQFRSLAELMAKATPARSGDQLAGLAAESAAERVAARAGGVLEVDARGRGVCAAIVLPPPG